MAVFLLLFLSASSLFSASFDEVVSLALTASPDAEAAELNHEAMLLDIMEAELDDVYDFSIETAISPLSDGMDSIDVQSLSFSMISPDDNTSLTASVPFSIYYDGSGGEVFPSFSVSHVFDWGHTSNALEVSEGEFFSAIDNINRRQVCIIGKELAEELFPEGDAVGSYVSVFRQQAKSFLVVGVLEERDDSLGASYNTALFMPYNTYVQRFRRTDQVGTYVVKVAEGYDATVAADDIEQYLDEIAGEDYYRIFSPATVKEMSDSVMSAFSMFLAAIAAISLIVGGIGIMNIMMVSVVERTGEIGIRKALGATEKAIRSQFLTESVVLSASGGLIGLAAGIAISSAAAGIEGWSLHVSAGAVASSLIFPLLIGIFFGWYPAAKAARLQPMEALARD